MGTSSWEEAQESCGALVSGGRLAVVDEDYKIRYLMENLGGGEEKKGRQMKGFWLGGIRDAGSINIVWIDGKTHTVSDFTEISAQYLCLEMRNGTILPERCTRLQRYVCEVEAYNDDQDGNATFSNRYLSRLGLER